MIANEQINKIAWENFTFWESNKIEWFDRVGFEQGDATWNRTVKEGYLKRSHLDQN